MSTGQMQQVLRGHTSAITSLAFLSSDTRLVSASRDETLRLWDAISGDTLQTLAGHTGEILALAISPDETSVASAGSDGTIRWWDVESGDQRRKLVKAWCKEHLPVSVQAQRRLAFSPQMP